MLRFFARIMLVGSLLLFPALTATAAQDEILLAKMKVVREIDLGGVLEYEVECEGRGRAILKMSPLRLKAGEAVNLFVQEGIKEGGKPAYMVLKSDSPRSFKEGFASARVGRLCRFIDKNGRLITQRGFRQARDFQDGFALVETDEGYGFLGKDGKLLPTPMITIHDYSNINFMDQRTGFSEGMAIMRSRTTDNKDVVIMLDHSGSVVQILNEVSATGVAKPFSEGLAVVNRWGKHERYRGAETHLRAYMDKGGKIVIPFEFSDANPFKEGRAAVALSDNVHNSNANWGFIDKSGKMVIDTKYDAVDDFSEGLAGVKIGDKCGFIDKDGNIRINLTYDAVFPFSEGLAVVRQNGLYGAVDKNGKVVIKFLYGDMKPFANGLAAAREAKFGSKYGYIDKTGKFVIDAQFSYAEAFSDGLALVRHDLNNVPRYKYINTKGQAALWFYMPSR